MEDAKQADLNLKIAELFELDAYVAISGPQKGEVLVEAFPYSPYKLDYINDPVQREPLMLALFKRNVFPHRESPPTKDFNDLYWVWRTEFYGIYKWNKHFGTAACLAFVEMMESKGAS